MKKILGVLAFAVLLMAVDNFASAQNQSAATVGNPDSDNMLIIEEEYQSVTVPVSAQAADQTPAAAGNGSAPAEGNVPVAPASANGIPVQPQSSASQPEADMPSAVMDEVTEVDTPDTTAVEASETVYQ